MHLLLRHAGGALSSIVSSHAIQHYRRPALELYGDEGTANLLGDDWDPAGFELWQNTAGTWELHEPIDSTWLWTDGLRELVQAIRQERAPRCSESWDLHLVEILESARAVDRRAPPDPGRVDLRPARAAARADARAAPPARPHATARRAMTDTQSPPASAR